MKTKQIVTLGVVGAMGVAVGVASAYLDPKYVDPTTVITSAQDENEPSDEFKSCCATWHDNKHHLALVFKMVGNLVVAPIVYIGVERFNSAYGNILGLE